MTESITVGKKTIYFDDEKHKFWDEERAAIPSVTTFTGVIDKSGALIGWAIKLTKQYLLDRIENGEQITILDIEEAAKEHRKFKEAAADIGTQIHEWIDRWIKGEKPEIPEDDKIRNGITAFLKFQKEYNVKWLESEKIVYSPKYNFAGILDAVGMIDKKLVLIDFKSSNYIYPEHSFQAAAYQLAYEEMTKKKISHRLIVRFGKDTGDFEWRKFDQNKKDQQVFLACKTIRERLKEF